MQISDVKLGQTWKRKNGNLVIIDSFGEFRGKKEAYLKPASGFGRGSNKTVENIIKELTIVNGPE